MSASLVGSEMCIRDRCTSGTWDSRSPARARGGLSSRPATQWGHHERKGTVSYTHLTLPTICSV
eukprot:10737265-Alexandrium_andersonii.AAC.1